jgi:hypothetical protein
MTTLTATEARANLYRVIDETAELHVPVRITKKEIMQFYCLKKIGILLKKLYICCLYLGCVNP